MEVGVEQMIEVGRWLGGEKESDKEDEALQALHMGGFIRNTRRGNIKGERDGWDERQKKLCHANLAGASLRTGRVDGAGEGS